MKSMAFLLIVLAVGVMWCLDATFHFGTFHCIVDISVTDVGIVIVIISALMFVSRKETARPIVLESSSIKNDRPAPEEKNEQPCYHPRHLRVYTHRGSHCGGCGKRF